MNLPKYDIKMPAKKMGRNHTQYDTKCLEIVAKIFCL